MEVGYVYLNTPELKHRIWKFGIEISVLLSTALFSIPVTLPAVRFRCTAVQSCVSLLQSGPGLAAASSSELLRRCPSAVRRGWHRCRVADRHVAPLA